MKNTRLIELNYKADVYLNVLNSTLDGRDNVILTRDNKSINFPSKCFNVHNISKEYDAIKIAILEEIERIFSVTYERTTLRHKLIRLIEFHISKNYILSCVKPTHPLNPWINLEWVSAEGIMISNKHVDKKHFRLIKWDNVSTDYIKLIRAILKDMVK